jgi:aminoglycoside phosphotransferase (APT) family kinase protein
MAPHSAAAKHMLTGELERLVALHVPGVGTVEIQLVSGGLVNETYRVVRDGSAYALRAASSNPGDLGLDGAWEVRVLERAASMNLAPVPVFCDPRRRLLISRWVEGRSWNSADVRLQENISRMTDLVRRIHALPVPAPARLMGPAKWIDHYSAAAVRGRGRDRTSPVAAALRRAATRRLTDLKVLPSVDPVLCHSDLHTLNLIDRGDSLVLLDWEYAHAADPFWDLAGWSANNDFGDELRNGLLAAYTGRPPTLSEELRLQLQCWLYDYVCLLWCELYLDPDRDPGPFAAAPQSAAQRAAARGGVAARAAELTARLGATASSRAD